MTIEKFLLAVGMLNDSQENWRHKFIFNFFDVQNKRIIHKNDMYEVFNYFFLAMNKVDFELYELT